MFNKEGEVLGITERCGMSTGQKKKKKKKKDGKVFDPVILLKYVRELLKNSL